MKKIFLTLVSLLLAAILLCSASPSLDGRADVASSGTFPPGLFAKVVSYLPGDTIMVTNPLNGSKIEILVVGSVDPSEGVAILLSAEAAELLQIKKDSNMLVKITKRSGDLDEQVRGNAVLAQGASAIGTTNSDATTVAPTTVAPTSAVEPIKDISPVAPTAVEETTLAEETPLTEETIPVEDVAVEDAVVNDATVVENIEDVTNDVPPSEPTLEDETIPVETIVATEDDNVKTNDEEDEIAEEISDEPIILASDITEEKVSENEIPLEDKKDEVVIAEDEIKDEDTVLEEIVEGENLPSENTVEEETVVAESILEPDTESENVEPETVIEESVLPLEKIAEENVSDDEYDAIVLVPVAENPPVQEDTISDAPIVNEEVVTTDAVESVDEEKDENILEIENVLDVDSPSGVTTLSSLEKGKYYVQIAVYNKMENVDDVTARYGEKYPIVVMPRKNNNGFELMVGPLNVDEYGAIIERFRAYGFKDAFMKKGK